MLKAPENNIKHRLFDLGVYVPSFLTLSALCDGDADDVECQDCAKTPEEKAPSVDRTRATFEEVQKAGTA